MYKATQLSACVASALWRAGERSRSGGVYAHIVERTSGSFFPQTIRDWNALPDSLISSAEDAEDCVAKFTSLVRARD